MRLIVAGSIVVLAAMASRPVLAQAGGGESSLISGRKAALEGRYDEAVRELTSAAEALKAAGAKEHLAEAYVYLGMAELGLSHETQAGESLRKALSANPSLTLSPARFSPRMIDLFRAAGGRVTPERKKPKALLWALSGAAAVAGPALVYRSKQAEQDRVNNDYEQRRADVERQNAEAQRAADEWNAQWTRDDDGDGLSEAQGDCDDKNASVNPSGRITPTFSFRMSGDTNCTTPFAGEESVSATNLSCTAEDVTLTVTGTVMYDDECTSTDPVYIIEPRAFSVSLSPGETKTLYSRSGDSRLDCSCDTGCHRTHRFGETWTFVSSQGTVSQPRGYWFYTATCPRCSACFK
jgi:hypothetical protein